QPLTEVGRDLDANARGPAVERAQQVAGPVGRARDTEPAGGGECVHERATLGADVMIDDVHCRVVDVRVDRVAEQHQLQDRRGEDDALGAWIAEDLAPLLAQQAANTRPRDAHRAIRSRKASAARPSPMIAKATENSYCAKTATTPTPERKSPRVTVTK